MLYPPSLLTNFDGDMAGTNAGSKTERLMQIIEEARGTVLKASTIIQIASKAGSIVTAVEDDPAIRLTLLQHSSAVYQQAAVLSTIAVLYYSVYTNENHRLGRLLELMISLHRDTVGVQSFNGQLQNVHQRVMQERGEDDGDTLVCQAGTVSQGIMAQTSHSTESATNEQVPVELYVKQRGRSQGRRDSPQLSGGTRLRKEDLRQMTYHRLEGSFQRLRTIREALFRDVVKDGDDLTQLRFDAINAVWLSSSFDCVVDGHRNSAHYQRLLDVVIDVPEPSKRHTYHCTPLDLATAMSKLSIDVGMMFLEDPKHIIWPLGDDTGNAHSVVVLCNKEGYRWRYTAVELLADGQQRRRQPPTFEQLLRPGLRSVQADFQGLVNRSVKGWKSFPFLKLPAEVRLQIYDRYLEAGDHCDRISTHVVSELRMEVPAPRGRCAFNSSELLRPEQSWMAWPGAANIQEVFITLPQMRGVCITIFPSGYRLSRLLHLSGSTKRYQVQIKAFEELVRIIIEDHTTPGMSLQDLAAVLDFGNSVFHF
ncbi:hypothetical protein CLAFUW4_06979 [Fulvia fulva]|nr:hypothetical protein CLAFUR4_06988 [Fulvia fulva]KAK4622978.1 hypothetical protein CLAFUR0_06986 [Fulvia fulva]WPV16778.1 hypothetical protein CLAFUW4_06979 [Fulvia fulva]WPV31495.1 hypothetical protein CLAFUW7_06979 [Fulvia fulva]